MKLFNYIFPVLAASCLFGCSYPLSSGQHSGTKDPFFITTTPLTVKNITVPTGTKLTYTLPDTRGKSKSGEQAELMDEAYLYRIEPPSNHSITWGGVPIASFLRYPSIEQSGFWVNPEMRNLPEKNRTKFAQLWRSCDKYIDSFQHAALGVNIKDKRDWSSNANNIVDFSSCTVLFQRGAKDDGSQKKFLDDLLAALLNVPTK